MPKQGVIVLAHGSRRAEANEEVLKLATMLSEKEGLGFYSDVAFLQGGGPSLADTIAKAVTGGCTSIFVVPFFLTSGVHIQEDLPELLGRVRQNHPHLDLVECHPLGCDPKLTCILWERVTEKMNLKNMEVK